MTTCTFFGHRECYRLDTEKLKRTLTELVASGVDAFFVGHQGNFDGIVYQCLKGLRKVHPHIHVCVVLAYLPGETPPLMDMSDTMYPPIEGHPKFAIERRNRWMIDNSSYCVCYINQTWGGAYKFAQMAKRKGLEVINLGTLCTI